MCTWHLQWMKTHQHFRCPTKTHLRVHFIWLGRDIYSSSTFRLAAWTTVVCCSTWHHCTIRLRLYAICNVLIGLMWQLTSYHLLPTLNVRPRTGHKGPEREYMYSSTFCLISRWLTPRLGRFTPAKESWYPLYRKLGGLQGKSGRVRKISPLPRSDARTVQPTASRYTDCAIAAHRWRDDIKIYVKEATW
jgi:hypothetical protein